MSPAPQSMDSMQKKAPHSRRTVWVILFAVVLIGSAIWYAVQRGSFSDRPERPTGEELIELMTAPPISQEAEKAILEAVRNDVHQLRK